MSVMFLLSLNANFKRIWCFCQLTVTGKPSVPGKVDLRNDPEESIMEVDNLASDDLFDDHSVTDISDANETGDLQTVTGKSSLPPKLPQKLVFVNISLLERYQNTKLCCFISS